MRDWINPELFENKYDNRRKILAFPQGRLFIVTDSDPKEFKRFVYAVRGLVEAVEVTESGQIIQKANDWVNKILELDRQDINNQLRERRQTAGSLVQDDRDNIIGIATGNSNPDGTVEVIINGLAQVIADTVQVVGTGDRVRTSGDIINLMSENYSPRPQLNLYEIVVKFLRENGRWEFNEYRVDGKIHKMNFAMPADLAILDIEYNFGSQRVNFLVWSQYFEKNEDGGIPMVHELVFADLKPAKAERNEQGESLRKLLIDNELETENRE